LKGVVFNLLEEVMVRNTRPYIKAAYPNATILELGEGGMRPVAYEDTEHFSVTRDFLDRYPSMLRVLLEEEDES
jgi:predicted ATPase